MFNRNALIGLSAVVILSACASTQDKVGASTRNQSDNQPQPLVTTVSLGATPVSEPVSPESASAKSLPDLVAPPAAQQLVQATMPYQCMLAVTKTIQDAMSPWMGSAKNCNASPTAQR